MNAKLYPEKLQFSAVTVMIYISRNGSYVYAQDGIRISAQAAPDYVYSNAIASNPPQYNVPCYSGSIDFSTIYFLIIIY